jgi:hypothetical protein
MKSPPQQYTDGVAHQLTEAFIAGSSVNGPEPTRTETVATTERAARR